MEQIRTALWIVCSIGCFSLFIVMGFRTALSEKPISLYRWVTLTEDKLRNVKIYNNEVGKMWISIALVFGFNGLLGYIDKSLGAVILALCLCPGLPLMVRRYNRILRQNLLPTNEEEILK